MKRLYLIRHAKSSWEDPEWTDFERPLNKRGKRDALEMGCRLARKGIRVDSIVTSPAKRAKVTAEILAGKIGFSLDKILEDLRLYEAEISDILKVIASFDRRHRSVMVFGHNPGLTLFIRHFAGCALENLPTCGIAELCFKADEWGELQWKKAVRYEIDYPKKKTK